MNKNEKKQASPMRRSPGALTIGEAIPSDIVPRYDSSANVRLGTHERGHAADNFADGSGSWWPWKKN